MKTTIRLLGSVALTFTLAMGGMALAQDIDFGDDSSAFANDGECDDPRFEGPGAAAFSVAADEMRDATDCREAFEAGTVTLARGAPASGETSSRSQADAGEIDFGDDSGNWTHDGECDDGRFQGIGMGLTSPDYFGTDATDCRTLFEAGDITYIGTPEPLPAPEQPGIPAAPVGVVNGVDYGDDSGFFPLDGECDDPRFAGDGVWSNAGADGIRADASDCLAAVEAGTATYVGDGNGQGQGGQDDVFINFGDDSGIWANDRECDDPRFEGAGMGIADERHLMADASDCRAAYEAGTITLAGDNGDNGRGTDEPVINFGDDSSDTAMDGVCDDPRFQGPGGASLLYAANMMADASDCRAAYEAGTVTFAP